jgi:hypothetical protein
VGADATKRLLALAVRDFQALQSPQALDALLVDALSLAPQLVISTLPAPAWVVRGELAKSALMLELVVGGWRR